MGQSEIGKVTEHLLNLITKQVEDNGIVVRYDPEKSYPGFIETLSIPDTIILRYKDSFFLVCAFRLNRLKTNVTSKYQLTSWKGLILSFTAIL